MRALPYCSWGISVISWKFCCHLSRRLTPESVAESHLWPAGSLATAAWECLVPRVPTLFRPRYGTQPCIGSTSLRPFSGLAAVLTASQAPLGGNLSFLCLGKRILHSVVSLTGAFLPVSPPQSQGHQKGSALNGPFVHPRGPVLHCPGPDESLVSRNKPEGRQPNPALELPKGRSTVVR